MPKTIVLVSPFSDIAINHKPVSSSGFTFKPTKETEKTQAKNALDNIVNKLAKDIANTASSNADW